jgi:hypothetical protein
MAESDLYPPTNSSRALSRCFTANGRQSRPTRRGDAPSDLRPKLRQVLDGLTNCPAPRRSRLPSIANSRSSKRIPVPVPLSGFQRELVAEVWLPLPRGLDRSLSLPALSLSLSRSLVVLRSQSMPMAPKSIGKGFSSFLGRHLRIRFAPNSWLSRKSKPFARDR